MLLLPAPRAIAEDAAPAATGAEVAKPSVEELAIPVVAQKNVEALYRENPKILGVVRSTVDFYWRMKKQPHQRKKQSPKTQRPT